MGREAMGGGSPPSEERSKDEPFIPLSFSVFEHLVFKDFLGNLEISTSKLPCATRSVGGYATVTATNLFFLFRTKCPVI